jgi:hypothetical protein
VEVGDEAAFRVALDGERADLVITDSQLAWTSCAKSANAGLTSPSSCSPTRAPSKLPWTR